ncbi:MAG: ATP-dependent Clp protease ATP-binding subunit [Opitutaceae bacterium]|nr:ATP-dependent Clp protease ATP-binding subunit [Opitutaceae bacterium]
MIDPARIEQLRGLEAHLRSRIIGQDHLLPRVAAVFGSGECGIVDPARPRGSLLFAGPTGSGKSETFKCAVEYALGPGKLVAFDMSEYQDELAVHRLLGQGRDDPGLLGRALIAHPDGALFFDEMDKAWVSLLDVFLQILWDGRVTVATGQTFHFGNYYVGFATNIGGAEAMRMAHSSATRVEQAVLRRLRECLRPELFGRLDEVLVFQKLTSDAQRRICELEVRRETSRLCGVGYDLEISREAMEFLVREGFHPQLGARPLRKMVERQLQGAVVRRLYASGSGCGMVVRDASGSGLMIAQSD